MRVGNEAWICAQQQPAAHETSHNCQAEEKHNELKVGTFWIFAVIRRGRILVRIGFEFFAAHVCRMQAVRKKVWRPIFINTRSVLSRCTADDCPGSTEAVRVHAIARRLSA